MQFYTFLATAHVTLSLVPVFMKFFDDGDLPGDTGMLAASFVTFSKFQMSNFFNAMASTRFTFLMFTYDFQIFSVLNAAFSLSLLGFLILHLSLVTSNTTTIEVITLKL